MSAYCDTAPGHPWHGPYHDTEYGFPLTGDAQLLERLSLEIFQAGLSWLIVLKKRTAIHDAFKGFEIETVSTFDSNDIDRLLADSSIIRNRRKIEAIITNAQVIAAMQSEEGGFEGWLCRHHPRDLTDWVKLFKTRFRFTGKEVVNEFLMSTGYLPGAHRSDCPVYQEIIAHKPPWLIASG
jgi:DNA-3-methyladenine glycosylase I